MTNRSSPSSCYRRRRRRGSRGASGPHHLQRHVRGAGGGCRRRSFRSLQWVDDEGGFWAPAECETLPRSCAVQSRRRVLTIDRQPAAGRVDDVLRCDPDVRLLDDRPLEFVRLSAPELDLLRPDSDRDLTGATGECLAPDTYLRPATETDAVDAADRARDQVGGAEETCDKRGCGRLVQLGGC